MVASPGWLEEIMKVSSFAWLRGFPHCSGHSWICPHRPLKLWVAAQGQTRSDGYEVGSRLAAGSFVLVGKRTRGSPGCSESYFHRSPRKIHGRATSEVEAVQVPPLLKGSGWEAWVVQFFLYVLIDRPLCSLGNLACQGKRIQ